MASLALRPLIWKWISPGRLHHEALRLLLAGNIVRQRDSQSAGNGAFA